MTSINDFLYITDEKELGVRKDFLLKYAMDQHKNNESENAIRLLNHYINTCGIDIGICMNLSDIYFSHSQFEKSVSLMKSLNAKWPEYASAYCGLAKSLFFQSKYDELMFVLNGGANHIDKFAGSELKNFCIIYANFSLKYSPSLRNYDVFEILNSNFKDDEDAIALYKLRNTTYPSLNSNENLYNLILNKYENNKSFLITRPGNIEVKAILNNKFTSSLKTNAGICEPDPNISSQSFLEWSNKYNDAMMCSDAVMLVQTYVDIVSPYCDFIQIRDNNFYNYIGNIEIWLKLIEKLLKNSKLLFISSFSDSISINKMKLNEIHNNLYDFNISNIVEVRAPLTLASEPDKSWLTEQSDLMYKINQIDYDIAFVSCGGYGHSVCYDIHMSGKSAIYIGGILQLFFGIIGNRWITDNSFRTKHVNEYWTRPLEKEIPKDSHLVENSCYW